MARFKIVNSNRKYGDGIQLLDVCRDEGEDDDITLNLMPMLREYLHLSENKVIDECVWDYYFYDMQVPVSAALDNQVVGTL
jgi:hypothetical protein